MSVDSKAFVVTPKENFHKVAKSVAMALNEWVREALDKAVEESEYLNRLHYIKNNGDFTNGVRISCSDDFEYYQITFTIRGEKRMLGMFTNCDCDVKEYTDGPVFIFSIGPWGLHKEIMRIVYEALKEYGEVWYDENDCDNEGYVKIN